MYDKKLFDTVVSNIGRMTGEDMSPYITNSNTAPRHPQLGWKPCIEYDVKLLKSRTRNGRTYKKGETVKGMWYGGSNLGIMLSVGCTCIGLDAKQGVEFDLIP